MLGESIFFKLHTCINVYMHIMRMKHGRMYRHSCIHPSIHKGAKNTSRQPIFFPGLISPGIYLVEEPGFSKKHVFCGILRPNLRISILERAPLDARFLSMPHALSHVRATFRVGLLPISRRTNFALCAAGTSFEKLSQSQRTASRHLRALARPCAY